MAIALLTDFGTKDYFVGAVKGAILSINRQATIVDITHEIAPQNIAAAGFMLRACYKNFPEKTIFIAVVDPGVGSDRRAILVETADYYFLAPDNGLLSLVFDAEKEFKVFELKNKSFFAVNVSRTFHGRDIFAPVAAHLSNGVQPDKFGAEIESFVVMEAAAPRKISESEIEAEVICVDRFGNLITNLRKTDLTEGFTLEVGGATVNELLQFYSESSAGGLFIIEGSAGFLEIAAFQKSAQEILRVEAGEKISVRS
jgi:S-adenosyl-L-methionine hydrolase (adenosine-forming)